jgi:hypothetical protein
MALRFRFTDERDVAQYGDGWWVWDERDLAQMRGRDLIALEDQVDLPLWQIRRDLRTGSTLASMAAMWIAMTCAGTPVGAWVDFNPAVGLTDWEVAPQAPLASGEDPVPDSDSSTTPAPSPESATS